MLRQSSTQTPKIVDRVSVHVICLQLRHLRTSGIRCILPKLYKSAKTVNCCFQKTVMYTVFFNNKGVVLQKPCKTVDTINTKYYFLRRTDSTKIQDQTLECIESKFYMKTHLPSSPNWCMNILSTSTSL